MSKTAIHFATISGMLALVMFALIMLCSQAHVAWGANEPYVIGAVLDMSGPGSPLGTPEADTLKMLEKKVNAKGGINGHPVKVVIYDNASDEAQSVMAMKKLIESNHVLAIIGSSQTGTTLAGAATVEAAKVPLVSCASGVKIVQPQKPWIFKTAQSDVHAVGKILDYLKAHRISKIALISVANAFGDSGKNQFIAQAPGAKVNIATMESFGDKDTDMKAQLMRIRGCRVQAVVCYGTNPGPAIVAKNMQALGMKMPLIMSHGIANKKFIELAGPAANGIVFPAGKVLVANTLPNTDPQKKVLLDYANSFTKEYHRDADTFGGHAYDAFSLICQALKKVGPDRQKLRNELERSHYVGVGGMFRFSSADHNGLSKDAFAMVRIVNGQWTLAQ